MLRNYFKISWRYLTRNRTYALINTIGLALGLACAILAFTLVRFQLSYDQFHRYKDRIFRVVTEFHNEQISYDAGVPQPLGKALHDDCAIPEKTARVVSYRNTLISLPDEKDQKKFQEENGVAFAEPAFFDIFDFPLAAGDPVTALLHPHSAIVTQSIAKKYFGSKDAMGRRIRLDNKIDFTITGILKDLPPNTDRPEEIYLSYDNLKDRDGYLASDSSWGSVYSGSMCFVRLPSSASATAVDKSLARISDKYYNAHDAKIYHFRLQPLADIHFNSAFDGHVEKNYLWALSIIGLLVVLTACVNFINLATAQALNRSKEVGVRKVLGSGRFQLFWLFISETALITLAALVLAYGLCRLALPGLNHLVRSQMDLGLLSGWQLPVFLFLVCLAVIFLSGSYPGLVLARFQPVLALKSRLSMTHVGGFSLRRILVVAQFTITQLLVISTIVITSQIRYSVTTNLGFDKAAIADLPIPVNDRNRMNTLRNELKSIPGVESISFCYQPPAADDNTTTTFRFDDHPDNVPWTINIKPADEQYLSTFGLQLVAGRNFSTSDINRAFLVNETFVKKLKLASPADAIGRTIRLSGDAASSPIIGVVKDFYNRSFHNPLEPICILPNPNQYSTCSVKINPLDTRSALGSIEKAWNGVYPEYMYGYRFLDDQLAEFYILDNIVLTLIEIFAAMAIVVGCLGLFGLVSFMAVRKTKEIGIRKLLGAGLRQILWLFGREFSRLLLLAFVLAAPIAWWAMQFYLQTFQYRIRIGAGIFALSILITFLIAALTVGYRSLRSALANPVDSLRTE